MQFKVPQDVQREDHIVGPLTLKQLITCGIGGGIAYAIYVLLAKNYIWITWFPPVAIVTIVTLAFAFVRPLDLSFPKYLLCLIEHALIPQKRYWIQSSAEVKHPLTSATATQNKTNQKAADKAENRADKEKTLDEITKILDSH